MENVQKALIMGTGLMITLALVTVGVAIFVTAKDMTVIAQDNFGDVQHELANSEFVSFDETTMTGSQVLNAIRKYGSTDAFGIGVETNTSGNVVWYNKAISSTTVDSVTVYSISTLGSAGGSISDATTVTEPEYINPNAKFKSVLRENQNEAIIGIVFTQQ